MKSGFISEKYPNIPNEIILELADANMHDDLKRAREEMTEWAFESHLTDRTYYRL